MEQFEWKSFFPENLNAITNYWKMNFQCTLDENVSSSGKSYDLIEDERFLKDSWFFFLSIFDPFWPKKKKQTTFSTSKHFQIFLDVKNELDKNEALLFEFIEPELLFETNTRPLNIKILKAEINLFESQKNNQIISTYTMTIIRKNSICF